MPQRRWDASLLLRLLRCLPHARFSLCAQAAQQVCAALVASTLFPRFNPLSFWLLGPCLIGATSDRNTAISMGEPNSHQLGSMHSAQLLCALLADSPHGCCSNSGRKHRDNAKEYYAQFVSKQAQSVIDQIISRHMSAGGGTAAAPGGGFPPAPGMMGNAPPPPGMMGGHGPPPGFGGPFGRMFRIPLHPCHLFPSSPSLSLLPHERRRSLLCPRQRLSPYHEIKHHASFSKILGSPGNPTSGSA